MQHTLLLRCYCEASSDCCTAVMASKHADKPAALQQSIVLEHFLHALAVAFFQMTANAYVTCVAVGSGETAARLAFDKIIQPAAIRFQPNIILISAGYDAHWRDPLEKLNFYSSTYHFLTRRVKQLSNKLCGEALSALVTLAAMPGSLQSCLVNRWCAARSLMSSVRNSVCPYACKKCLAM